MRDVAVLINDADDKNTKNRKSNMSSKCFTIDKIRFKGDGKAIILT